MPLRVRQCSMSRTNVSGSSLGERCWRNPIFGWTVVTTTGASSSSPSVSTTPRTRSPAVITRSTFAFNRSSAPWKTAESAHAFPTAPIPPSG